MPGVGNPLRRHDISSVEDFIYYNAKQQRHLNDAQRRIQDWMRVMPDLIGNNKVSATVQESNKCNCRDCKDNGKKAARKDEKKKKEKRKQKRKEKGKKERKDKDKDKRKSKC
jgi:hypothetical protein